MEQGSAPTAHSSSASDEHTPASCQEGKGTGRKAVKETVWERGSLPGPQPQWREFHAFSRELTHRSTITRVRAHPRI